MGRTTDERATFERFSKKYELGQSGIMREIERSVCGCDYGATSWTTRDEARDIGELLALAPGKRLLDIGSGSGWPAVYLAKETGCAVTMTDLPVTGLQLALDRAAADGVAGACRAAVADAAALPFRGGWFDAIHHADVLCCLVEKLAVLKACRRAIGAGGTMVFTVISIAPGLSAADYGRAAASGPPFIESDMPYKEMLGRAGWEIGDHRDVTANYQLTLARMLEKLEAHADEIAGLFGETEASDERARRRATLAALDDGLLRRELFRVAPSAG